jgi:hypothetical protein
MCICSRNWQGNDCNQRVCQFGLAHVDTPKGDLDMSGALTGSNHIVADNHPVYPYGTTEQFPQMEDTDLRALTNSAHYYMECSNKGSCNRATGECQCFDGYDGVACQRASCPGFPNSCSGHGVCKTIAQLAGSVSGNTYKLWDQEATMGCECDAGYSGPDCSQHECKYGVDPLYLDDAATAKVGTYDFAILSTDSAGVSPFTDGQARVGQGKWAIRFFDAHGEDWLTTAIPAWATCAEVVAALESLPNNVIPASSVDCYRSEYTTTGPSEALQWQGSTTNNGHTYTLYYKMALWTTISDPDITTAANLPDSWDTATKIGNTPDFVGDIYRLKFRGNPGALKEPQIELYLDGKRPSLMAPGFKIATFVVTDGQQGESNDYFADHCDGVTVTIAAITGATATDYVALSMTAAEEKLLKACLGDADGDSTDNVEVYDWDYGTASYPHLIKLVRTVTTYQDGGYYAALWYNGGIFKLVNPFVAPDASTTDQYDVYTTKGTLKRTSSRMSAVFGYGEHYVITANTTADTITGYAGTYDYDGDISCETGDTYYVQNCLNQSDIFTVLDFASPRNNPRYINLYTAQRIWTKDFSRRSNEYSGAAVDQLRRGTHRIETDLALNWGGTDATGQTFQIYKFVPAAASTYNYVAQCANRGICNTDTGVCQCFSGYTGDNCATQDSLAL